MKIFADMKGKKRKVRQVVHTSSPSTKTEAEGAKLFSRKSDTQRQVDHQVQGQSGTHGESKARKIILGQFPIKVRKGS